MSDDFAASKRALPVSTILLTKNSGATLEQYFTNMQRIDDIILLDGGSTDTTLEIAARYGNCQVYPQPSEFLDEQGYIIDFSGVRNFGYSKAKHPWILCIDSDETLDPDLEAAIEKVIRENRIGVYFVHRQFYVRGKPVVMFKKSSSDQIRLFHLEAAPRCVKPVHERLDVQPGAHKGTLPGEVPVILEYSPSIRAKHDRYLAIEVERNKNITWGTWLRWLLLRNIVSSVRQILVHIATYLIPKPGPRLPWWFAWELVRYKILSTIRTCPLFRKRTQ